MTQTEHQPAITQHWCAPNDNNGNPRRCFVIWSDDGILLDVIDEGYSGPPRWVRDLVQLGDVIVRPSDYKAMLKHAAK
jgi:hypothetical protein